MKENLPVGNQENFGPVEAASSQEPKKSIKQKIGIFFSSVPLGILGLSGPFLLKGNEPQFKEFFLTYLCPMVGLAFIYNFFVEIGLIKGTIRSRIEKTFDAFFTGIGTLIAGAVALAIGCLVLAAIGAIIYFGFSMMASLGVTILLIIIILILLFK